MKWYYTVVGGHTHVRVFMNGGKCGDLCFRNEEFERVKTSLQSQSIIITFIDETATSRNHPEPGDIDYGFGIIGDRS